MSKEEVQISPNQLTFLIITMVISTADIYLPAFVAMEAKKDSWISAIAATLYMIGIAWINLKLYSLYQGKTLMDICQETAGKWVGGILDLMYIVYFFLIAWGVVGEMSQVLNTAFLPETPPWAFTVFTVLVSLYAVSKDIEVIARVNEILLPLGLGALGLLMVVNFGELDFNNFLPVLNEGILPPLRGSLIITGWMSETVVVLQIAHFVNKPDLINKSVYSGILIIGSGIISGTLIYALFGPLTEVFLMPALEFARFASIGKYIQGLDILVIAIWITGIYVKIMFFYYAGTYSITRLFGGKNYKALSIPVGIFLTVISLSIQESMTKTLDFLHYIFPLFNLTMGFIIPVILLITSLLKKKTKDRSQALGQKEKQNHTVGRKEEKSNVKKKENRKEEMKGSNQ